MLLVLLWSCLSEEKCTEAFDQTYETGTIERSICEARVCGRHVNLSAPSYPVYPNYILRITFYSESRKDNKLKIVKILKMHEVTGKRNKVAFCEKFPNKIALQ